MEEWKEYSLSDIAKYSQGKQIPIQLQYEEKNDSLIRFIRIVDYTSNWSQPPRYVLKDSKYHIKSDDIIMIRYGTPGKVFRGHEGLIANNMFKISVNEDIIDKGFAFWYLSMDIIFKQLMSFQASTTMPAISFGMLKNITIKVPSKKTQLKITKIFDTIDDKIEVNRRINEQLEELAQALFKSWFVDFEPFKDGEFVESELGMIPEGWNVGKFTDIIDIKGGGTPKTDIAEYWNGDIPFFTPKDINDVFCISTEKNITDLGLSKCSSKLYSKNTVFITARGTVGKVCMAGRDMAMNQTCYALIGKKNFGQHFIYMQTISIVERMKKKANGAVFSAITTRDFDSEKIIIPSLDIVSDYLMKIEPLYESILHNQQEITHLTNLRDTLLPKLMSGEIDVNEVEI